MNPPSKPDWHLISSVVVRSLLLDVACVKVKVSTSDSEGERASAYVYFTRLYMFM